jgi:hypothetical protein
MSIRQLSPSVSDLLREVYNLEFDREVVSIYTQKDLVFSNEFWNALELYFEARSEMFSDIGPNRKSIEGYETWRNIIHEMMRPDHLYRAHAFPITPNDSRKSLCDRVDNEISDIEDFVDIFGPKGWAELEYAHNSYNQTVIEINSRRMLSHYFKTLIRRLAEFNRLYRNCNPANNNAMSEDEARRSVNEIFGNVEIYRAHTPHTPRMPHSRESKARYYEDEASYSYGLED